MAEQRDVLGRLQRGFVLALLLIFALLAVPLRSVSMMSMFGLVAVTGVVVNDSRIMVDFINRARAVHTGVGRKARQTGGGPTDRRAFETAGLALAVREAGVHRFRPILLNSLTTFVGLAAPTGDVGRRTPWCPAVPSGRGSADHVATASP